MRLSVCRRRAAMGDAAKGSSCPAESDRRPAAQGSARSSGSFFVSRSGEPICASCMTQVRPGDRTLACSGCGDPVHVGCAYGLSDGRGLLLVVRVSKPAFLMNPVTWELLAPRDPELRPLDGWTIAGHPVKVDPTLDDGVLRLCGREWKFDLSYEGMQKLWLELHRELDRHGDLLKVAV